MAEEGSSWKVWALTTGLKPYVVLGLLVLDGFVLVALDESSDPLVRWLSLAAIVPIVYSNLLAYAYLWARPSPSQRAGRPFHPSWKRPFLIGRLQPDRDEWLERVPATGEASVPAEEFL
ncbi:MAG: hypothetical protein KGJ23_05720 [Euryarchaeota archaeon]|nr:hypothetical protein [Euryarchaeota archaeon]MDE1879386.1 hypothetical protein [Euryarchaeota archaeon]MDE2044074.1 hypothetical protein [Thermoplasmata archaeon]